MEKQHDAQKDIQTIIRTGIRRPAWICRNVKQNVVLVRDRSGSMEGPKATEASAASQDLIQELAQPCNKDGFNVAIVDFSNSSNIVHDLENAAALNGAIHAIITDGMTNITSGLRDALDILTTVESAPQQEMHYLKPVVICFTDGQHNTGPHPRDVARELRQKADLVTVAFGADADESLMRELASTPQHFYRCSNGRELRNFLAAVGATLTMSIQAGTNATGLLGSIQQ